MKKMILVMVGVLGLTMFGLQCMPRDLIMLINDEENNQRLEATQITLFQALTTKAAPILMSGALWRNFAQARYDFDQQKDVDGTAENIVYNEIYRKIDDRLKAASPTDSISSAMFKVKTFAAFSQYVEQNAAFYEEIDQAIEKVTNLVGATGTPGMNLLEKKFAAYAIPFDASEWDIYTIKHAFYLLIPHEYAKRVVNESEASASFTSWPKFKDFPEPNDVGIFDEAVARLGFKTNNLTKLSEHTSYDLTRLPTEEKVSVFSLMQQILVKKWDIVPFKDQDGHDVEYYPFVWNVFLNGHGSYNVDPSTQRYLDLLLGKIKEIQSAIDEQIGYKPSFERQFKPEFREALYKEIDILQPFIAGMPSNDFSSLLDFLNDSIQTAFLLYTTCFSGTRNLLYPYINYFGHPKKLNYTVVAGTSEDLSTLAKSNVRELFRLTKGNRLGRSSIKIVQKEKRQEAFFIPASSEHDFTQFFSSLHNAKNPRRLKDITGFVLGETNMIGENVAYYKPVIRLPMSETFYVNDIDDQLARISRVTMSVAQAQGGALEIDATKKKIGVMLNTYYVPVEVRFKNGFPFTIASSIYRPTLPNGITGYYFKKIDCPGQGDIHPIFLSNPLLIGAFDALAKNDLNSNPVPKVFICDQVVNSMRPNAFNNFSNVLIFNRLVIPDIISDFLKNQIQPTPASDEQVLYITGCSYLAANDFGIFCYVVLSDSNNIKRVVKVKVQGNTVTEAVKEKINELYNDYKTALTQKAEKEGLTLIENLQDVSGAIAGKADMSKVQAMQEKIQQMKERAALREPMFEQNAAKRKQRGLDEKATKDSIKNLSRKLQELRAKTARELQQIEERGQEQPIQIK